MQLGTTQNICNNIRVFTKNFDGGVDFKIVDGEKNWPGVHGKALVGCSWERRAPAENGFGKFSLAFEGLS